MLLANVARKTTSSAKLSSADIKALEPQTSAAVVARSILDTVKTQWASHPLMARAVAA